MDHDDIAALVGDIARQVNLHAANQRLWYGTAATEPMVAADIRARDTMYAVGKDIARRLGTVSTYFNNGLLHGFGFDPGTAPEGLVAAKGRRHVPDITTDTGRGLAAEIRAANADRVDIARLTGLVGARTHVIVARDATRPILVAPADCWVHADPAWWTPIRDPLALLASS